MKFGLYKIFKLNKMIKILVICAVIAAMECTSSKWFTYISLLTFVI